MELEKRKKKLEIHRSSIVGRSPGSHVQTTTDIPIRSQFGVWNPGFVFPFPPSLALHICWLLVLLVLSLKSFNWLILLGWVVLSPQFRPEGLFGVEDRHLLILSFLLSACIIELFVWGCHGHYEAISSFILFWCCCSTKSYWIFQLWSWPKVISEPSAIQACLTTRSISPTRVSIPGWQIGGEGHSPHIVSMKTWYLFCANSR